MGGGFLLRELTIISVSFFLALKEVLNQLICFNHQEGKKKKKKKKEKYTACFRKLDNISQPDNDQFSFKRSQILIEFEETIQNFIIVKKKNHFSFPVNGIFKPEKKKKIKKTLNTRF